MKNIKKLITTFILAAILVASTNPLCAFAEAQLHESQSFSNIIGVGSADVVTDADGVFDENDYALGFGTSCDDITEESQTSSSIVGVGSAEAVEYDYILGDANSDGVLDKKDYMLIKRICFGTAATYYGYAGANTSNSNGESETLWTYSYICGDVNQDDVIDKRDYSEVKRMILNGIVKYVNINNGNPIIYELESSTVHGVTEALGVAVS